MTTTKKDIIALIRDFKESWANFPKDEKEKALNENIAIKVHIYKTSLCFNVDKWCSLMNREDGFIIKTEAEGTLEDLNLGFESMLESFVLSLVDYKAWCAIQGITPY